MSSNLEFVYNLGLKEELLNNTLTENKYQVKLESNRALQANIHVLLNQVNLLKSYNNTTVPNLEAYSQILNCLALCLLKRNTQAYNYSLNKLTKYGERLSTIRNNIYEGQNTEKGFLGTLLIHQVNNQQHLSINDFIEKTLINYWNYLEIDYLKAPRERFELVLNEIDLKLDINYYQNITDELLGLIESNSEVKKKFNSLLLDYIDIDNLFLKLLTLELDNEVELFLRWVYESDLMSQDLGVILDKSISYKPVGGVILTLLSFVVEGLVLASRYIKDLPISYRNLSVDNFIVLEDTTIYCQQIAEYLALSYDAAEWLGGVFEEFILLREAISVDLLKFIKDPIIAKGLYRLDG